MRDSQLIIATNINHFTHFIANNNFDANLVAVSKYRTTDEIFVAIKAGQKVFGENKVQEAKLKWPNIKKEYPDLRLHLIGSLQSNKCSDAVRIFDVIEVIDRKKIIDAIAKEVLKQKKHPKLLLQVNISNEEQKSGCKISEVEELINYAKSKHLRINGLMCIPKSNEDPANNFKKMKDLCNKYNLEICSMGMSNDYETALKCGSTQIRIGTAIFGPRKTQP